MSAEQNAFISEFFSRRSCGEGEADVLLDLLSRITSAPQPAETVFEIKHLISGETIKLLSREDDARKFFDDITEVDGVVGLLKYEILDRKGAID